MTFKRDDWFHNDLGAEVYIDSVDGDRVYYHPFKPGQASRIFIPVWMYADDFREELANHGMKPGRFPAHAHLHIGIEFPQGGAE